MLLTLCLIMGLMTGCEMTPEERMKKVEHDANWFAGTLSYVCLKGTLYYYRDGNGAVLAPVVVKGMYLECE